MSTLFRVSAKAIVLVDERVLLVRKPVGLWDLPGGRLEVGEAVETALRREGREELGLPLLIDRLVTCFVRPKRPPPDVVVAAYLCGLDGAPTEIRLSAEHVEADLFARDEIDGLTMEDCYKAAVHAGFDAGEGRTG